LLGLLGITAAAFGLSAVAYWSLGTGGQGQLLQSVSSFLSANQQYLINGGIGAVLTGLQDVIGQKLSDRPKFNIKQTLYSMVLGGTVGIQVAALFAAIDWAFPLSGVRDSGLLQLYGMNEKLAFIAGFLVKAIRAFGALAAGLMISLEYNALTAIFGRHLAKYTVRDQAIKAVDFNILKAPFAVLWGFFNQNYSPATIGLFGMVFPFRAAAQMVYDFLWGGVQAWAFNAQEPLRYKVQRLLARVTGRGYETERRAHKEIKAGRVLTAGILAREAGIAEEAAGRALEYLAGAEAEKLRLGGVDVRVNAAGEREYYALKAADMSKVRIVVLAGGGGERVWPASDGTYPKQFQSFSRDGKTMLAKTVDRLRRMGFADSQIMIATRDSFRHQVEESLPGFPGENIIGEPGKKDTGAAIALNLAYMEPGTTAVFLPADHVIAEHLSGREQREAETTFRRALESGIRAAQNRERVVATIGIQPTYAATQYGYVQPSVETKLGVEGTRVLQGEGFVEKPATRELAEEQVKAGNLWNAGMFMMQRDFGLELFETHAPEIAAAMREIRKVGEAARRGEPGAVAKVSALYNGIPKAAAVSVDFAIMEKLRQELVNVAGTFPWYDEGDWGSMTEPSDRRGNQVIGQGQARLEGNVRDMVVYAGRGSNVTVRDLQGLVVAVKDGMTLVMPKALAAKLKDLVGELKANPQAAAFVAGTATDRGPGVVVERDVERTVVTTDNGVVAVFGTKGVRVRQAGDRVVVEPEQPRPLAGRG
ncbi:MAG: sugar phosphate nucleotidyltransferase, partial [Actinomycetota bacterium]